MNDYEPITFEPLTLAGPPPPKPILEYVEAAVRESIENRDSPTGEDDEDHDPIKWVLSSLWTDLQHARTFRAINGVWAMACDDIVFRILALTPICGPTPWENVSIDLIEDGIYQKVHEMAGIEYPPIDYGRVAEVRARRSRLDEEARRG